MLTVKKLAELAGVTPRTLHHYDAIGLLKPSRVGPNGYRYYDERALLRLQQILFYRELDMSLDEIGQILDRRGFDVTRALESHREALKHRVTRLNRLIGTVDDTILHLKGEIVMTEEEFFVGFTEEEETRYTAEAMEQYDPATVKASAKRWKSYSASEKDDIRQEGRAVYRDLLSAMPHGAGSRQAQAAVARWRRHIERFWVPNDEQLLGLARLYNEDPRFRNNFDKLSPQLAEFIIEAVEMYVKKRPGSK